MGKVSPKDRESKTPKQKRRLKNSSNKYLKPGALAQFRYNKATAVKSYADLGKKSVALMAAKNAEHNDHAVQSKVMDKSPLMLSPVDVLKQNALVRTPKTPRMEEYDSESRLESLPMDLLVKILCHLHHDQLRAVFHVSQRIRKAVLLARQFHFNFTTPDRSRQEMLRTMTPRPTEHWPFVSKGDGKCVIIPSPHTPKAPKHGPRPPSRIKISDVRQITAVLFQDPAFHSRCMVPSVLPRPLCKSLASNRVLFYEEELCQAVAQNKLR
ncbi:F-box protein At4g35930 [Carica papaya]|uniref:F-box protein At4g35930 n=1 Tax=Carica papaya TaxID=3649 RepID=UPI000B8CADFA|nr:F-box protein At4g35930 [Carica papaya]XP_021908103.1 F-box protein At4g35930 [Carica papaya]XP_021908104.1 F-box protein At4g35930 [Carica papaya]